MTPEADSTEGGIPGGGWPDALARVLAFVRRHGPPHAALAMHAAVPLGLTPELLHLVRVNFLRRTTPWIAEADLLLSPLCQDVGDGFYQMDRAVRELLVDELRRDAAFGEAALRGVAELLLTYVAHTLPGARTGDERPFLLAQEWTALAYLRPAEAAEALAAALKQGLTEGRPTDALRVASVAEALAAPLRGEEKVLLYAAGVEKLAAGDAATAARLFDAIGPGEQAPVVGGVELPAPARLLAVAGRQAPGTAAAPRPRRAEGGERPAADADQVTVYHPRRVRTGREYPVFVFLGPPLAPFAPLSQGVHRDLKPGNVLLPPEGKRKVSDHGLGRRLYEAFREGGDQSLDRYVTSTAPLPRPAREADKGGEGAPREEDEVAIVPVMAPMDFEPPRLTLPLSPGFRQAEFRMRVPESRANLFDWPRLAEGSVEVRRGDHPVAQAPFRVSVTDSHLPTIFVSYRRSDRGNAVSLLCDRLVDRFGQRHVLWDIGALSVGAAWADVLSERITFSDVLLLVIGPGWLEPPDEGGRRLDQPGDFIRLEVETALRQSVPVMPVLVDGAALPRAEELPESLRPLLNFQAFLLRPDPYWSRDLDRLAAVLESFGAPAEEGQRGKAPGSEEKPQRRPGEPLTVPITELVAMRFVWCPPGTFLMGSPPDEQGRSTDERQHRVTLSGGFYLGEVPVTQEQWQVVMGNNPSRFQGDHRPVEQVTWEECQEFCRRLSARTGRRFRLPTEAEWEYACRASTTTPFSFGETISTAQANCEGIGKTGTFQRQTIPVREFRANAWGLHDMHGNIWEWCQDWYGPYPEGDFKDPQGQINGNFRVLRGGSWKDSPVRCRSAQREKLAASGRVNNVGCRVVLCLD